ncbi:hypothetical protein H2O64_06405 [Kordia sp. YSTF-M3]|uniref:Redoxin domain-containing protein n=1 Tax=Kordia aestuariivivens TaxID=2759037 RepID=A0ABR7Q6V6_9FLAO|nr:hypothetical protein [Kordia aestuariivivens]MBC8754295.1 hypothetical protein [Kordia aestuariivivens]
MMKKILLVCCCISLSGCAPKEPKCEFYEGFSFYMKEEHKVKITDESSKIYYLMPLAGCEPCVESNLEMLQTIPKSDSLLIIFIGTADIEKYALEAAALKTKHHYLEDIDRNISSYETNFGKPLLIHIENETCKAYNQITDLEVEEAKRYLEENIH